jgi:Ca2+-binding RTX toxin-like protein
VQVNAAGGDDLVLPGFKFPLDLLINGEGGNDTLYAGAGHDTLNGGSGNDSLIGDAGGDSLFGDSGNDTLFGPSGGNHLFGGSGTDTAANIPGDTFDSIENLT